MSQNLIRTEMVFGKEALACFQKATVAVAGLGGVGSMAAEVLARTGIGHIIIVDFDILSETDINRQVIASYDTLGKPKTDVMAARIKSINQRIKITACREFLDENNRHSLLKNCDFIIDAVDSLGPKTGLIEYAYHQRIPIISCMGAGNRTDPAKIRVADIEAANGCPLLKRVKKYLRKREIRSGINVIFSTEPPILSSENMTNSTFRGRDRNIIGSVSYLPIIMGSWAASFVLKKISENSIKPR